MECKAGAVAIGGKSWSSIIEAISRCIAAFQKATDATEHSQCQCIATKVCDYAIALARKTPAYCGHEDLLALVHQFMQNRVYNLAFTHLLDRAICSREHEDDDSFWSLVRGRGEKECLQTIEQNRITVGELGGHPLISEEMAPHSLHDINIEAFDRDQGSKEMFSDFNSSQGSAMLSRFDDTEIMDNDVILTSKRSYQRELLIKQLL